MRRLLGATTIVLMIGGAAPAREKRWRASAPPAPEASEQQAGLSKADYVRLLAAEVERHMPHRTNAPIGKAEVVFTIGASGRVVDYKLVSATNRPQVEPVIRRIMAAIRMPPPPGGSLVARQELRFKDEERPLLPADYFRAIFRAMAERKARALTPHGVVAILRVNGTGRVDEVKIAHASNAKEAQIARALLLGMKVPPPPDGPVHVKACFTEKRDDDATRAGRSAYCDALDSGAN